MYTFLFILLFIIIQQLSNNFWLWNLKIKSFSLRNPSPQTYSVAHSEVLLLSAFWGFDVAQEASPFTLTTVIH